jgi:hypothetical protein
VGALTYFSGNRRQQLAIRPQPFVNQPAQPLYVVSVLRQIDLKFEEAFDSWRAQSVQPCMDRSVGDSKDPSCPVVRQLKVLDYLSH